MTNARRTRGWLIGLWLLIATIIGHAVLPAGSAAARTPGSAFSFTTSDVSLGPTRRDPAARQMIEKRGPGPDAAAAATVIIAPASAAPAAMPAPDHLNPPPAGRNETACPWPVQDFDATGPPAA